MAMSVLQLGAYPPPHGGVQTHVVALRQFLLERDIPCAAINLTRFRGAEGDGIYYPKNALGVARLLLLLPYPIIHLHVGGNVTPRLLGLSLLCSRLPRRRTVLTFHSGGYPSSEAGRTAHPRTLRGFVFRRFDRVIAVNQAIAALFGRFGLDPDRIRLIPPFAMPERTAALRAIADGDLLLRTTWYDGDSISVREALHPVRGARQARRATSFPRSPTWTAPRACRSSTAS